MTIMECLEDIASSDSMYMILWLFMVECYFVQIFSRLQRADRPLIPVGLNRIIEQLRMFLKQQHQVFPT